MRWADIADLFTPFVIIPAYFMLYFAYDEKAQNTKTFPVFVLFVVFWVLGHGLHLSANSIGHHLNKSSADVYLLTEFYDELLSHYIWHIGMIGLSTVLIFRSLSEEHRSNNRVPENAILTFGSVLYGLTYFITVIESATVPIGVPYSVIVSLISIRLITDIKHNPVLRFFVFAQFLSLILFAIWWLYWGGFPEFSQVGIIK